MRDQRVRKFASEIVHDCVETRFRCFSTGSRGPAGLAEFLRQLLHLRHGGFFCLLVGKPFVGQRFCCLIQLLLQLLQVSLDALNSCAILESQKRTATGRLREKG